MKPCPFCKRTEIEVIRLSEIYGDGIDCKDDWVARCTWCGAQGESVANEIRAEQLWNQR